VAQIGAAIGRQFPYTLLRAICRLPEDELQSSLARLVASALVSERGTAPNAVYTFKHALVQDAAYGSLLRNSRRVLHAQIAEGLEAHSPEITESQPELLAQHYAEAGLAEKAASYWGKAGHRSASRSAMAEAAAQFQKGLDQLLLMPENPDRQRQELEFRCGLAAALQDVKGAGASETGHAYACARELWEHLGSPSEFLHVPWGQSRYHIYRGEFDLALRLAEDVLDRSSQRNDSGGLVLGHHSAGQVLMLAGKFAACQLHLEEVLARYDPIPHQSLAHQAGHHPHIHAQSLLGLALFCLGYPEQAVARSDAAMAEARRLAHPPSSAVSLANGILLLWLVGDDALLNERAEELVAVATEQGFPGWHALGTTFRGWVKVKTGDVAQGLFLLRSGSATNRATGAELIVPYSLALLAEAHEIAGQTRDAMTQLDDALEVVERTGEHWLAAKLYRHKGRLLLGQGDFEAAEELYQRALSVAREQQAKIWELRAAVSLARLRRDQGRRAEARGLLAPVFGWFTEGFDTPDLMEAKLLLEGLVD